jgi:hypothetical protein
MGSNQKHGRTIRTIHSLGGGKRMAINMELVKIVDGEEKTIIIKSSEIWSDTIIIKVHGEQEEEKVDSFEALNKIQELVKDGWELIA